MRICSLLPSATEIVCGLGLADSLVGRSAECNWPPEVGRLPVVTAARIDTSELASFETDQAVRRAMADGRSVYALDEELVEALDPDFVLTQDLCTVCAVSSGEVNRLCAVDAEVVALDRHRARIPQPPPRSATRMRLGRRQVRDDERAEVHRPDARPEEA
jgi:iron complex transport system substrate-binding protein